MVRKGIREFINVDNISQDVTWNKVRDKVFDFMGTLNSDDTLEIDFSGVNVTDPWLFEGFMDMLKNDRIYMAFTNSEAIVNQIKITCMLESQNSDRFRNTFIEKPKEQTQSDKRLEMLGNQLVSYFKVDGDTATFRVVERFSQIQNNETCDYMAFAMKKVLENNKGTVKKIIIDLDKVSTQESVLRELASLVIAYNKIGITLGINVTDKNDTKTLGLFLHRLMNDSVTNKDKAKIIKKFIDKYPNAPGLFIKYKPSDAVDTFGRQGKGEVISCRVAILRSIELIDGRYTATIDTYNANGFFTRAHWASEHDNAILKKLPCDTIKATMSELGFMDSFMGSSYHFIEALQKDSSQTKNVIVGFNDSGSNIKIKCTIPEMMEYVFDDWDIEYNKELLSEAVEKSKGNK